MYSGSQHSDGTLEYKEARRIEASCREIEKFEEHLGERKISADIGIVQSDVSTY